MQQLFTGRYTAVTDQSFVLFLIGMRINRLWQVNQWWSVAKEMPPMMQALYQHPEKGFLGGYTALSWPTLVQVQYWRSFEALEHFARNPDDPHMAAWKRFYEKVGKSDVVGIWHETYEINPGQFECIYANMPRFGLGSVFDHQPIVGRMATARQRKQQIVVTV
ncbi:MAG: DUF4188 domain-containing protein [Caldilineaceae bacterium]